ncbi:hypothetical protein HYX19_05315 [Candidatus Woesearchaeota archaeon]|nr:hypothetical protein [Candidatus Woesearchaeota archaeon]
METKELERLGLTENESKVYLALLQLGSINADPIIKKTGLHRNIVYDNLNRLIDKGLATFVLKTNRRYFEATSTYQLLKLIQDKKEDILEREDLAKKILPEIESLRALSKEKQEVSVFKGKKGLITALEDVIESKELVYILGTGSGMKETLGHYYSQWHKKLKKEKIKAKLLLSIKAKDNKKHPIKARFIPETYKIPVTTFIYGNKVLSLIWGEDLIAILIKSEKVSGSYKVYFNVLWKISKS